MRRGWKTVLNNGRKEDTRQTMLTTKGLRLIGVPIVFFLECVVIMMLFFFKNIKTNRDIENSPVRNIYSIGDRVWESGDQLQCRIQ
jgi:hypothetical protein